MNMFIKRFAKVPVMQLPASRPGRDGLRGRGEEGPLVAKKENNNQPGVNRSRRKLRRILIPLLILAILAGVCTAYLTTYYPADETAIQAFSADYTVEEHVLENGDLTFGTGHEDYGWIFYPGGKVAEDAYAPLMCRLAANGVFCVICKMPCHLAVLDENAADGIREAYPGVKHWYLGGHSLGGVMAADYLAGHDGFDGLVLLASYASKDLSDSGLGVLSVRGSEDGVMNAGDYEKNRANLPPDTGELVIEGGCHAGFGMYGEQRGDGMPTISTEEQIRLAADAIFSLMRERGA